MKYLIAFFSLILFLIALIAGAGLVAYVALALGDVIGFQGILFPVGAS